MHSKLVQRLVWLILFVLMAPLLPVTGAIEARSTVVSLEIPRHDWTSKEVVEVDLRLRNAPYNEVMRAEFVPVVESDDTSDWTGLDTDWGA